MNICIMAIIFLWQVLQGDAQPIKVIIWDAGSTLIEVNRLAIAREMGLKYSLSLLWNFKKPQAIHKLMFDILEQYQGKQQPSLANGLYTRDDYDLPLPHFMSDTWLCSRISNKEILAMVHEAITSWQGCPPLQLHQKVMIKKMISVALCAAILGKHARCIRKGIKIVKYLKQHGYDQYILSNFDKETFEITYKNKKNSLLFSSIPRSNIVISGECGFIKPHPDIYHFFLTKYQLNPHHCLLIDDRPENIQAARDCGMKALLMEKGNFRKLLKQIKHILQHK